MYLFYKLLADYLDKNYNKNNNYIIYKKYQNIVFDSFFKII